jgi:hypothetical protein
MELKEQMVSGCDHGLDKMSQEMQGVSSVQAIPPKAPGTNTFNLELQ